MDRCGKIVGITTAIIAEAQSIGFAVPANLIKGVIPKLVSDGRVIRPWLGVQGQFVPPVLKELLRTPLTDGFLVEAVEPGSPAEKAGLQDGEFELTVGGEPILLGGDIITGLNGTRLDGIEKLRRVLDSLKVGEKMELTIFRKSREVHMDVAIVERPLMPWDLPNRKTGSPAATIPQDGKPVRSLNTMLSNKPMIF